MSRGRTKGVLDLKLILKPLQFLTALVWVEEAKTKLPLPRLKGHLKVLRQWEQGENRQACVSVTPGFPSHPDLFSVFRNNSLILETLFTFLTLTNKFFKLQSRYHNQTYKAIHIPCSIMKRRALRLGI